MDVRGNGVVSCAPSARRASALSEREVSFGGDGGIRTHEGVNPTSLAVKRFRPLSHVSIYEHKHILKNTLVYSCTLSYMKLLGYL